MVYDRLKYVLEKGRGPNSAFFPTRQDDTMMSSYFSI